MTNLLRSCGRLAAMLAVLAVLPAPVSAVAPASGGAKSATLSIEFLEAKIAELEATPDLGAEAKAGLVELYRKTITNLQTVAAQKQIAESFERSAGTAGPASARVRAELESKTAAPVELGVSTSDSLNEMEAALLKEQANRAALDSKLAEIEAQLTEESERPAIVRARLAEANRMIAEVTAELDRSKVATTPEEFARDWLFEARRAALAAEIRALDQELLSQPMRLDLLNAERDHAALSVERSGARLADLEAIVLERRRYETELATAEAEEAMRDVDAKHPVLQRILQANADLTGAIAAVNEKLERGTGRAEAARNLAGRVEEDFRSAKEKLEVAGLSQALGMVLQEQRRTLPDITTTRKQVADREYAIAEAALRQIQYREERRALRSLSGYFSAAVARLPREEAATIDDAVRDEFDEHARARRKLLDQALELDRTYLRLLGELDFAQRGLIETVVSFEQYLTGRLLWIRTAPAVTVADIVGIPHEAATILAPARWAEFGAALLEQLRYSPTFALGIIAFLLLWWKRGRLKTLLHETGLDVGKPTSDEFVNTLRALFLTAVLAAPWPMLPALVAWHVGSAPGSTEFARAVAASLGWTVQTFAMIEFFRCVCLPGGLADAHFGWTGTTRRKLRSELARLMLGFVGFGSVISLLVNFDDVPLTGGLGRVALLGSLVTVGIFANGMLNAETGALRSHLGFESSGLLARFRSVWVALAILAIVVLAGLTLAGYFYAAAALVVRSVYTVGLFFGIAVLHEMIVRWFDLTQKRFAYRAAVERRAAAREAREKIERAEGGPTEVQPAVEEPAVLDIEALGEEAQKLIDAALWVVAVIGLWLVWWTVLPAFDVLDEITVWSTTGVVGGETTQVPVTVGDLGLALLLGLLATIAAQRLPALIQFAVLERLSVSAGSQYAITTLTRYAVGAIGFGVVTKTIGLDWSQLQWLVAALGVGIGFGLQEIVANFISGLIILFERPVRVGDVVTVGDTDGVVTRIRIRATTIRTWDRKELLVPNKEFVTSRLLNWSLSDQISRITINVGVDYSADVRRAMDLMLEAAREHSNVLAEPAPIVAFEAFGADSLALSLRCFVGSIDFRLGTISDLHEAINRRFKEAKISIAFPQRDVHLASAGPLDLRVHVATDPLP
jgi:potassium efflux system protein